MRIKLVIGLVVAVVAAAVAPVMTVTNGQPDGNNHPYVGIAIQPIPSCPASCLCAPDRRSLRRDS